MIDRGVRSAGRLVIVAAPVLLAICISMVVIQLTGRPSAQALRALLQGALGGRVAIARTISYILPLTFVALGWIVAFTSRRINVGLEGQIVVGGTAAAVIGLYVHGLPRPLHLLLASTVGALAGAGYAGIAAWLWARRGVNEIISTLLLNFIALQFLGWLVVGPLKEPDVIFPRSSPLAPSARWPSVLSNTALTWNIVLVPVVVIAVWFLLRRTSFGFALRVTGANPELARHLGLPTEKITVLALLIAGGIAGLAGGSLVLSAETSRLMDGFSSEFGFDGIVVALVAWNSPLGTVPAAFLFAILRSGGGLMESLTGVPLELVLITQGLVIILVSSTTFLLENVRKRAKPFRFPARRKRAAEVERVG